MPIVTVMQECHRLCEEDGRCLKWTLQVGAGACWLKGAGGLQRQDAGGGLVSGTPIPRLAGWIMANGMDEVQTPCSVTRVLV